MTANNASESAHAGLPGGTPHIIIKGLTSSGRTFRPSDWAERLSGVMSTFGTDHRMSYSPYVRPVTIEGVKCVVVDVKLQERAPRAYSFLMAFAQDNDLQIVDGRAASEGS